MVDVGPKEPTERTATARGRIYIPQIAYELITTARPSPVSGEQGRPLSLTERAKAKSQAKGDVLTVAQLAAIMGCKRTSDLIPLCHPLQLSHIAVELRPEITHQSERVEDAQHSECAENKSLLAPDGARYSIVCEATVKCQGKTGVEMEALTAVSVGLLTVWDMLKAVGGKDMVIGDIVVSEKHGGKSGNWVRTVS